MPTVPDCNLPLPNSALRGVELFNQKRYFEAHEALETAWRAEHRPVRLLYQGILQVGVAYHHILRGNYSGALKVLERGLRCLDSLPEICQGVQVAALRADALKVQAELVRLGRENLACFDRVLLQPILVNSHPTEESHAL